MNKPIQNIISFVMEKADEEPLARRAQLYRDLSQFVPDEKASARLNDVAARLDAIEHTTRQLTLDLTA